MKIYQESSFVKEGNKIICTIACKYVPYFCGHPVEEKAIEFSVSDYAKCHQMMSLMRLMDSISLKHGHLFGSIAKLNRFLHVKLIGFVLK